ncbi:hypothetical protein BSL78_17293 [Apostichopus japonicus]|uniref:Uncharacterized protein n=1 Tax=Stichopus japonicus TaxID=307972 RepID=A0A2G8KCW5_STIJA|nr:hypothetical protein BSL78_17293 [Apostichopus japonicus]
MAAEVASQPASYSSVVCNNKEDTTNMPLDISPDDSKENVQPPAEQNDLLDASADKDDEGEETERREGDHARKTDAGPHGKSEASEPLREQKNETSNARKIEAAPPPKVNVWMKPVAHNEHNEVTFGESQPQPVVVEKPVIPEVVAAVESVPDSVKNVDDPQSWPTLEEVKSNDPESPKQKHSLKEQPDDHVTLEEDAVAMEEPAVESTSPVSKPERNQRTSANKKKAEKKPKWKPLPIDLESSRSRSNRGRNRDQRNHGRALSEQDTPAKDRRGGGSAAEEKSPGHVSEGRSFHTQRGGFRGRGEVAGEDEAEVVADLVTQLSIGTIVVGA